MKHIIKQLFNLNLSVATFESATGGALASALTNFQGSSSVFKGGMILYSDQQKITFGHISQELINKKGVYSIAMAQAMAKQACLHFKANLGFGVTGMLPPCNLENPHALKVYASLYDSRLQQYYDCYFTFQANMGRADCKQLIVKKCLSLIANNIIINTN